MSEQLDLSTFSGAHPSNREFVDQLAVWKFVQRKVDGVHLVFRGPSGGTLRVVRSLLGRADAAVVEKAARLLRVEVAQFWAGPHIPVASPIARAPRGATAPSAVVTDLRQQPATPTRDRIISLVLAVHTRADRPLGFEQVVELCHGAVSRDQARHASSVLCRDRDLDRIRSGVYQWSGGERARRAIPSPRPAAPAPRPVSTPVPARAVVPRPGRVTTADLFDQLFPHGVRMNAQVLADFERWAELTEKLAAHADAS